MLSLRGQGDTPEVAHMASLGGEGRALTWPRAQPPLARVCPFCAFISTLKGK